MRTAFRPASNLVMNAPRADVVSPVPLITRLGDFIAAAFDDALRVTSDPRRAAELAARKVERLLEAAGQRRLVEMLSAG